MDIQYNAPWSVHPPMNMMEPLSELAGDGFEPQTRARSNTWPLPRPENYVDPPDESNKCAALPVGLAGMEGGGGGGAAGVGVSSAGGGGLPMPTSVITASKKNSSRRNAWGNLSYADLITQAITSAPEKRLTLSQIYEWMVQNVPYFKDKGDSNSSAGWKNSIRHNLSLHNRFMRVQNEGTGKSSWWMINPDAKPGKSVRRRAASMETSKFEKRRGRVKKKVEALRNGSLTASGNVGVGPDATPSPSSSVSEGLDLFPDSPLHSATGFQLSPDFRPRASSATSSCGRLSPIPAVVGVEPDWSSPSPYTATPAAYSPEQMGTNTGSGGLNTGSYSPDQLAGNLEQGMKLQADAYLHGYVNGGQASQQQAPPPPYPTAYEPAFSATGGARRDLSGLATYGLSSHCPLHRLQPCACMQQQSMSPSPGMSPSYTQSEPSPDPMSNQFLIQNCTANGHTPRPPSSSPPLTPTSNHTSVMGHTASTMMGQLMGALNNSTLLDDLNLNIETLHGGFDCNVDEVIKHELSMEGSLDFNFTAGATQHHAHHHQHPHHQTQDVSATMSTQPPAATPSGAYSTNVTAPSWVH